MAVGDISAKIQKGGRVNQVLDSLPARARKEAADADRLLCRRLYTTFVDKS